MDYKDFKDEELAKKGDWDLGSGDTIPPEITLDEKAIEELKNASHEHSRVREVEERDKSVLHEVRNELNNILNELNRH